MPNAVMKAWRRVRRRKLTPPRVGAPAASPAPTSLPSRRRLFAFVAAALGLYTLAFIRGLPDTPPVPGVVLTREVILELVKTVAPFDGQFATQLSRKELHDGGEVVSAVFPRDCKHPTITVQQADADARTQQADAGFAVILPTDAGCRARLTAHSTAERTTTNLSSDDLYFGAKGDTAAIFDDLEVRAISGRLAEPVATAPASILAGASATFRVAASNLKIDVHLVRRGAGSALEVKFDPPSVGTLTQAKVGNDDVLWGPRMWHAFAYMADLKGILFAIGAVAALL